MSISCVPVTHRTWIYQERASKTGAELRFHHMLMVSDPLIPIAVTQSNLLLLLCSPDVARDFLLLVPLWIWNTGALAQGTETKLTQLDKVLGAFRSRGPGRHCWRRLFFAITVAYFCAVDSKELRALDKSIRLHPHGHQNVPKEKFTVPAVVKFNAAVVKLNCCSFPEWGGFSKKSLLFPSFTNFHNCGLKIMVWIYQNPVLPPKQPIYLCSCTSEIWLRSAHHRLLPGFAVLSPKRNDQTRLEETKERRDWRWVAAEGRAHSQGQQR